MISLARHSSNLQGSLSGPDDFDTLILSSSMKIQFSEICIGTILGSTQQLENFFSEWRVTTYLNWEFRVSAFDNLSVITLPLL